MTRWSKYSLAGLLICLALPRAPALAQEIRLPAECRVQIVGAFLPTMPDSVAKTVNRWLVLINRAQYADYGDSVAAAKFKAEVDSAWRSDPEFVEWTFAVIIGAENLSNEIEAGVAKLVYRRVSGRPGPVLSAMVKGMSAGSRWDLAVWAMKPPLTEQEQNLVFAEACRAYWLLAASAQDTTNAILFTRNPLLAAVGRASSQLEGTVTLLTGERQRTVQEWLKSLRE